MKLWLLEQDVNNGYDTYDSCVVAAETAEQAKLIHPSRYGSLSTLWDGNKWGYGDDTWAHPDDVEVTEIGEAIPELTGVICSSFNAG